MNPSAIVSTDLLDYAPGATALITANNFMPGANVTFQVQHMLAGADGVFDTADDVPDTLLNSSGSGHEPWIVTDGGPSDLDGLANGAISTSWYVNPDDSAGATFKLFASGLSASGVMETASTMFTDSTNQLWAWRNQGGSANSWDTNTVQGSNAIFADSDAIPFRWTSTATGNGDLQEGIFYTVRLEWTFSAGTNDPGQLFIDYLTTYNYTESATGPFPASFTGGSNSTISIPTDPDSTVKAQIAGVFTLYNIDSKSLQFVSGSVADPYVEVPINNNEAHKYIDIRFTPDDGDGVSNEKLNVGIAWGGHLASETVYGINNGSSNFPGASTTMSVDLNPSSKGDVSTLSINTNSAIVPQGTITIVKDAVPNSLQDFTFMASSSVPSTIPASFILDDDSGVAGADSTYSNSILFFGLNPGTYTFTENAVSGWSLTSLTAIENGASDTTANDIFTTNLGARTLTITIADGEVWTGTFSNTVIANSPPVVTTSGGVTAFTEGNNVASIPVVVDAAITVNDSDNATLSSGSVAITGAFQTGQDVLAFTNVPATMGNIIGTFNALTGVLSLSSAGATATLAQWQTALRSITYTNSSNTPNTSTRTISFRVNDGASDSNLATKQVSVTSVNDTPMGMSDSYTTPEDTVLNVPAPGVLGNDIDVDGDPLTSILVSGPSHGSLSFNSDGSFSYTPDLNYNGPDSFSYKANDGLLDSAPILVSLMITPVNDPPVNDPIAAGDSYTTPEDTVLNVSAPGVLGNDIDVDGDPLTSILVSGPSHGTLSFNADGSFSYTPNANYNGPDSFTYKANDGLLDSAPILVSLTITPVNDPPVNDPIAAGDSYSTPEDTVLNVPAPGVLGNDTDVDGDPLTSILVSGPSHGSLSFNSDGSFSYTPNANYNGPDSFTYKANDGSLDSAPILVSLMITPVNDPPVNDPSVAADSYSTPEDTVLNVPAPGVLGNDTDVDGDPLTSILVSGPSHGTLSFNADGSFSYTPNTNYNGSDSFTYKANDGALDSAPILVSLTITPVNDPPVNDPIAAGDSYTTPEDTVLNVPAPGVLGNDTDVDGDPLTSILVSGPSHGLLSFNSDGSFSYTPNANNNGSDSFTYKANDGALDSAPILVSLTITPVNDPPVNDPIAAGDSYTTPEDTVLNVPAPGVLANDIDVDGDPLTSILVSGPSHGLLSFNSDGSFSYTPDLNYNGPDSFSYKANDGLLDSAPILVSLTITPVNDPPVNDPVAAGDSYSTPEDTVLNVSAPGVLGNDTDVDGDPLTSILVSGPSHGLLSFNADGSFSYTPNANYNGPDSFTYKANDGSLDSAPILVSLTITPVNDPPVNDPSAAADSYSTPEDTVLNVPVPGVLGNDTDVDGDPLTSILVSGPSHGLLSFNSNGSFSYTPNANYNGPDSFTYKANDGSLDSAPILVSITVTNGSKNYLTTGLPLGSNGFLNPTESYVRKAGTSDAEQSIQSFPGFNGEVSVAHADFNKDGILDVVVAAGPGGGPHVRVINGATGEEFGSFFAYDPAFTGGVFVAAADINNDGIAEIITGAGPGGGPHVKVFDGLTFAEIKSFFAYDPSFRGGVSVAAYDYNKDGISEIVTGAGPGGSPHVKVFDGSSLQIVKEFMAYALTFRGGVYVAAGDFNGDLVPDIITGAGAGGGPHVIDWEYNTLKVLDSIMAFDNFTQPDGTVIDQLFSGGVRVAIGFANYDQKQDLIVGAGPGGGPHVKVYFKGNSLDQLFSYFSGDPLNAQGVFVA